MKAIALWASQNLLASRLLLILLHTILFTTALYSGLALALLGVSMPIWLIPVTVALVCIGLLTYPFSKSGHFAARKLLDFGFAVAAFVLLFSFSNQTPLPTIDQPRAVPIVERGIALEKAPQEVSGFKRVLRAPKTWIQKRMQKRATQWGSVIQEYRPGLVVLFIFLTALAAFGIGILVAALSCSIACSGFEVAAVIVLILGWGGVITGAVFAIRATIRKWGHRANS